MNAGSSRFRKNTHQEHFPNPGFENSSVTVQGTPSKFPKMTCSHHMKVSRRSCLECNKSLYLAGTIFSFRRTPAICEIGKTRTYEY